MAAVGDVIEVKAFQTLLNVSGDILNVFHFQVTAVSGAPVINNMGADFLLSFYQGYLANMIAAQSSRLTHVRLEVNNLMDYNEEFGVFVPDPAIAGGVAGPYMAASTSLSFQFVRLFRTTRHGRKSVAGVPESYVDDNVVVSAALANVLAIGQDWEAEVEVGDGTPSITMRPVIIRKPPLVSTPPTVINPVTEVLFRGVGTQNSRKQLLS